MNFKALRIKFKKFKTIIKLKKFERHNYAVKLKNSIIFVSFYRIESNKVMRHSLLLFHL